MRKPILDNYGRPTTKLRITLTHKCNYKCIYCHMEGEETKEEVEMTPEEIERLVSIAVQLGISKIKLTGGEPLLREDLSEIIRRISKIKGIEDIAITTNGSLLKKLAAELAEAGLMRLNVNLPTIDPNTYRRITCVDRRPEEIIEGILKCKNAGISPIKVNMVILKGINDNEISKMMKFTRENGLILQLIELEKVGIDEKIYRKYYFKLDEIERELEKKAVKIIIRRDMQNRRRFRLADGTEVEIVRPYENGSFCQACTRIRLTADGKLKPCLMRNDNLVDILTPLRLGAEDTELKKIFIEAIKRREPYWKLKDTFSKCSI